MQIAAKNENLWLPPYSPFTTEKEGINRINGGMKVIWFEMREGNLAFWKRGNK